MSERDRQLVIDAWNRTEMPGTTQVPVTELFAASVARNATAVAVEAEGKRISYGELHARAARIAAALRSEIAGRDDLVALCLPRSADQIAALMGVLRAGAGYLPLEVALPDERIRAVLDAADPRLVVTSRALRRRFASRAPVFEIEDLEPIAPAPSGEPRPEDLAYVIYTSGSTGTPKGVEIAHGSLANFARFAVDYFAIAPGDRVLQFASLGFDTAAEEIFPTLAAGATLVLRSDAMLDSVDTFLDRCEADRLSVLDLPTAYWHTLIEVAAGRRPFPSSVRAVILGGEAARADLLARWRAWAGTTVRLFNGYGPTETTICATYGDLTLTARDAAEGPVSIGTPVWNTQVYVLDATGQPVPPEVPGEIHVGGAGVARGYRHDAALSAERFLPDPWRPGGRLYRTGDRARWRRTGELEYLGRLDRQVKIRGHRVEPDEVEIHLQAHPMVREAAVVVDAAGADPRLVAYAGTGDAAPDACELRDFLAARLPAAMVPSAFVCLRALPRNINGKVDRSALPAPPAPLHTDPAAKSFSVTEHAIAVVWREVLRLPHVGAHDNFFDLGGHSLAGTRVVARLADALDLRVPLSLLFEHPTVAALAAAIDRLRADGSSRRQPIGRHAPIRRLHAEVRGPEARSSKEAG